MTPYDPAKVRAFLELACGAEVDLFCGAGTVRQIREFERLTPWERANCLYGMRDRALEAMNAKIRFMVAAAREADDDAEGT